MRIAVIRENPFRLLGLPATATSREVRRRVEELAVKASLGASPELDADRLSRIRQALEDPVQRLGHEVFWLHSSPDVVGPSIDPTSAAAATSAAFDVLRSRAGRPPSLAQAISLHDLAVLTYGRYELGPEAQDPSDILPLWAEVQTADGFWEYLKGRAVEAHDPRLTPNLVERIRIDLAGVVLGPIAERAATLIEEQRFDSAAVVLRAIRRSGLLPEAIDSAASVAVAPLRDRLRRGAAVVEEILASVPASENVTASTRAKFTKAEDVLVLNLLAPFNRLKEVDPLFADAALADEVAAAAHRLSVGVCNALRDWVWGYALLRLAIETARTPVRVGEFAGDQALVRANFHRSRATAAIEKDEPLIAAAHLELALPYASSESERAEWSLLLTGARLSGANEVGRLSDVSVEMTKQAVTTELEEREGSLRARIREASNGPLADLEPFEEETVLPVVPPVSQQLGHRALATPRRRHWGRWFAAVVAASSIAGGVIAGTHSGSKGAASNRSGVPAPVQPVPAAPDNAVVGSSAQCASMTPLNAVIGRLKAEIAGKRRLLARINSEEAPIATQLATINRDYPSHELPANVWNRYVPLRREFKTFDAQSSTAVREGNALISSFNTKIKTYNRLVKKC